MKKHPLTRFGFMFLGLLMLTFYPTSIVTAQVTWGTPTSLTISQTSQDANTFPQVLQMANGTIWLVWEWEAPLAKPTLLYRINNGGAWSPGARVTGDMHQNTHPTLAQLANGTMLFVWATDRLGSRDLYYKTHNGTRWGPEMPLVTVPEQDESPRAMTARNGSVWVVWHRRTSTYANIYYKIFNGIQWSADTQLTTGGNMDQYPSITQSKDGRIWVTWMRPSVDQQIFYKVYDGASWTPDAQLVTSNLDDSYPWIVQDRDGTLWVFFNRAVRLGANSYEDALFYITSTSNGATWSTPVQLTGGPADSPYDDDSPAVTQMKDKTLWLVWMSTRPPNFSFNVWLMTSNQIITHDLAVTSMSASPLKIRRGESALITVSSANLGDYSEFYTLKLQGNSTLIGQQNITLAQGFITTNTFNWTTYSSLSLGKYYLAATAGPVPGETLGNTGDNTLKTGSICLVPPADVDRDGDVDIFDAARVGRAYDSRAGDPNWNPDADLNHNGVVDIFDAVLVGRWFDTKVNC